MSIVVSFGTFDKRKNSTKRIPTSSLTSFNCNLKEPCTVLNPVVELSTSTKMSNYNVARISDFGRYYFVKEDDYDRRNFRCWQLYRHPTLFTSKPCCSAWHSVQFITSTYEPSLKQVASISLNLVGSAGVCSCTVSPPHAVKRHAQAAKSSKTNKKDSVLFIAWSP